MENQIFRYRPYK